MAIQDLTLMSKTDLGKFIRQRLSFESLRSNMRKVDMEQFDNEHLRFEMSGYEDNIGECTLHNISIVNRFADLGIYNYTNYLFLDFHKGHGKLYLQYFMGGDNLEIDLAGYGTVEIIEEIFKYTIFSGKPARRRES